MTHRSMTARLDALEHLIGTFSTTQTPSSGVDVKGLRSAEVVVYVGTVTNINTSPGPGWTFTLQDSDSESASFGAVDDVDVVVEDGGSISSGVFATIDDDTDDDKIYRVGYVGDKRYIRVVATAVATPGNTPISVMVLGEKLLVAD